MIRLSLFFALLLLPFNALAEVPAELLKDFAPVSGYVVMPMGDSEFLIDLDSEDGIRTGDIFSIVHKGEAIVHPVSGEIIGHLDGSKAFLQVTRIKSGYSYVRKLSGNADIIKGAKIQRFISVPAIFRSKVGGNQDFKTELQASLAQLDWQADDSGITPILIFERDQKTLRVMTNGGVALFTYPISASAAVTQPPRIGAVITPDSKSTETAPAASGIIRNSQQDEKIWHALEQGDEAVGLLIDDLDQDGQQETAFLLNRKLIVSRLVGAQKTLITEMLINRGLTPLGIDSFDLNGNGKPELFLSATRDNVPASCVYELEKQSLKEITCNLPMLFRRIDQPQGGTIILGQKRFDLTVAFSKRPFSVRFVAGKYEKGDDYPLPQSVNLYGFTPFVSAQGKTSFAFLNSSDYLTIISPTGDRKFESPDRYGGSELKFELKTVASSDIPLTYFLPQRVLFVNGEILTLQNDGQRLTQRWRKYTKSRLVSLKWNGLSLDENWRTSDQSGQSADFAVADIDNDGQQELVLAVKFSRRSIFSSAKSALVIYETHQ